MGERALADFPHRAKLATIALKMAFLMLRRISEVGRASSLRVVLGAA